MKCPSCGHRDIKIWHYRCNYSAFNGYHYTPSNYSRVICVGCGHAWRSKADGVYRLLHLTKDQKQNYVKSGKVVDLK